MVETSQIVGSVVLVVMGIVFHLLKDMAIAGDISWRSLWKKVSWLFPVSPSSSAPFYLDQLFLWAAAMSVAFLGIGISTHNNYAVTGWCFLAAWLLATVALWQAFSALIYGARMTWTILSSAGVAFLLLTIYGNICPTVTISPSRVSFGSISASTDTSESYNFRIQNRTDDDLYMVFFKLRVESSSVTSNDFYFDVPKSSQRAMDESTDVGRKFADIGGMNCSDAKNQPVFLRFITHLAPGDSREVTLSRVNPKADSTPPSGAPPPKITAPQNDSAAISVRSTISGFSHNSGQIIRPGLQGKRTPPMDETLTCNAVFTIILKE
jgi:hypothetical protein